MAPKKPAALREGQTLHDHLLETAVRMIGERGTSGLTVRAIAREAGVADGVLYNYFSGREELLAKALLEHVQGVERRLGELPLPGQASVEENLRVHLEHGMALHKAILPAFAGLLAEPAVLARFGELSEKSGHWRDELVKYLRGERLLGRLRPGAPVEAAAAMVVGVCHETVLSTLFPHTASANPPSIDAVVTAVLEGVG